MLKRMRHQHPTKRKSKVKRGSHGVACIPEKTRLLARAFGILFASLFLAHPAVAEEIRPLCTEPVRSVDARLLEQRRAFLRGTAIDWRIDTDAHQNVAPPPIQKAYAVDSRRLALVAPDQFTVGTMSVKEAIQRRRSRREFSKAAFSREELSYLLWSTQGISQVDTNETGQVIAHYRTVPSGGARHPFESYLAISRVEGIAPGLYRYLPIEHQLLLIKEDATIGAQVMAACYGQACVGQSAVTFIWAALPYRTEWKYGIIAQKLVAIEAGHICQNLYLAAESLHGGVCACVGYSQARLDALLGLDGKDEFVVYLSVAGKLVGSGESDVPRKRDNQQ